MSPQSQPQFLRASEREEKEEEEEEEQLKNGKETTEVQRERSGNGEIRE